MDKIYWLVKTAGALFAVLGGCGCGLSMAAGKKRRIRELRELEQAVTLLYGEIEYAAADMVEILDRLAVGTYYFSSFFEGVSRRLRGKHGQPLYTIWQEEIDVSPAGSCLEERDRELWEELGRHLGGLDRQTQLHTLQIWQERIRERVEEAEREYDLQAKVYRILGVTSGLFAVILLL